MASCSRLSSDHAVVDEPLRRMIAVELQAAIHGAVVRLYSC